MEILNYTPHPLNVYRDGVCILSVESEGIPVRVNEIIEESEEICSIPTVNKRYDEIVGLPPEKYDSIIVVSIIVLQAAKSLGLERDDLVCPDTGPDGAVRDEKGRILGTKRFQR